MKDFNKKPQFEQDVNWCIEELKHHFIDRPYWEETTVANFTRDHGVNKPYWKLVNKEATKRLTNTPTTLLHKEAYRELNRMTLFAINIMAGSLLDCRYNNNLLKQALEEILTITHDQLSVRAPNTLSEHDHTLECIQNCIDHFCQSIGEPSADFIDFADKMNKLRIKNEVNLKRNEHSTKQRNK